MKIEISFDTPNFGQRDCSICNSKDLDLLFKQKFARIHGVSFLAGYDVVACKKCGFVYASNIPEQEIFDNYYTKMNKYENDFEQPDGFTGKYEHIITEILSLNYQKDISIVDVGCGRSEILRKLKNFGYTNLTGIDPALKNIEYLSTKGIKGVRSLIKDINKNKQYDIVIFSAVLEHIRDLHSTLDILSNITKTDGLLIIDVPDLTDPCVGELPFQEFSTEHINYFTPNSLLNLLSNYKFIKYRLKTHNGALTALFRKQVSCDANLINQIYDPSSTDSIKDYIKFSQKYERMIYTYLEYYTDKPLVVWGLGTFTQRLLAKNILHEIIALVDSNEKFAGKNYICDRGGGGKILSPYELKRYDQPIFISTSMRYVNDITDAIRNKLCLNNKIITLLGYYQSLLYT